MILVVAVLMLVTSGTVSVNALTGSEEATVTIDSVDKGSTATFYQVVEPNIEAGTGNLLGYNLKTGLVDPNEEIEVSYTDAGQPATKKMLASELDADGDGVITSPVTVGGVEYTFTNHAGDLIYDMSAPTQEQINKVVSKGLLGTAKYTATAGDGDRVQQIVTAGQYIVIITPVNSDNTYNPVVVSAGYKGQQKYKVADTQATPPEVGTHYKKLDGTFTETDPTAETKHLYEADAWDDTLNNGAGGKKDPKWIADGATSEDALVAKNLDADSNYSYVDIVGTTALAKKQNPDVEKKAETDHPENAQIALVATDAKGDPKLDNSGKLVYVKAPFSSTHHNNTKNGTTSYKLVDGVVSEWVDGTDDASLKLTLDKMETKDAHEATTVADTAYNAGQGEEVRYTVTPTIPQYPANAKNKTLSFTDKFETGIDFVPGSIDIYVDSADTPIIKQYTSADGTYLFLRPVAAGETGNYILDNGTYRPVETGETATHVLVAKAKEAPQGATGNTFQINFDYEALPQAEGSKEIKKITYKGLINENAIQGIPGNVNVVKMHYSNSTGQGSTWDIDRFEEPSGEGITEQHDEGRAYTYEIRFVKTNDKDQYITAERDAATHVRIPDAEDANWSPQEKEEYARLVAKAEKGYMADGTEHLYVLFSDFNTIVTSAVPDVSGLSEGLFKLNPDFEYLKGAVFGLYDASGKLVCEITTDDNGVGHTTNVSDGTYTLKEITPPAGYTKSNAVTTVTPNWTSASTWSTHSATRYIYTANITEAKDYDATKTPKAEQVGWLVGTGTNADFYDLYPTGTNMPAVTDYNETDHTAKIDGVLVNNVFAAYLKEEVTTSSETSNVVYNNNGGTYSVARINNTKTSELPSTGGIGTYMFTVAGVAILALAAFMLIFRRKEDSQH